MVEGGAIDAVDKAFDNGLCCLPEKAPVSVASLPTVLAWSPSLDDAKLARVAPRVCSDWLCRMI